MTRNERISAVKDSAERWRGNPKMWSAWNFQLLWIDFKMRWAFRLYRLRKFWLGLVSDQEYQRRKYTHDS